MSSNRPVVVLQLPEQLVGESAQSYFREIEPFLHADRPRMVFDFSGVTRLDSAGVEMLLNSMEEVMKRNGDLKLAAISPGPAAILELTSVDRLFEIYQHSSDAVESYQAFPSHAFHSPHSLGGGPSHESGDTL